MSATYSPLGQRGKNSSVLFLQISVNFENVCK